MQGKRVTSTRSFSIIHISVDYSNWIVYQKCQSLRPVFLKMATSNPEMIFLDVPVTESNANLHKGLGIESVPFAHVYHPERGLVEETKLSRETFSDFTELVEKHSS